MFVDYDVDTWLFAVHVHQPESYKQARREDTIQGIGEENVNLIEKKIVERL